MPTQIERMEARLADLEQQRQKLLARKRAAEARAAEKRRKQETRQRIVIGGAVVAEARRNREVATWVRRIAANPPSGRADDRRVLAPLVAELTEILSSSPAEESAAQAPAGAEARAAENAHPTDGASND